MFQGFSEATVDFMWGIRFNNERSWFEAHKAEYLDTFQRPMKALCDEVYQRFMDRHPDLDLIAKVSRIYRDARRLFGRGPYKDHLWVSLRHENDAWPCRPEFYFEINPEGYAWGMGFWGATPQVMERFRRLAAEDPAPFEKLVRRFNRQGDFTLQGEAYKRPKAAPSPLLTPWFSQKHIVLGREVPHDDAILSRRVVDTLKEEYDFLEPYYRYFAALCPEEPAP